MPGSGACGQRLRRGWQAGEGTLLLRGHQVPLATIDVQGLPHKLGKASLCETVEGAWRQRLQQSVPYAG